MKNIKKSTWIAIGCVALAIIASQMYSAMQEDAKSRDEVAVISEIQPTPIATPIATPKTVELPSAPSPAPVVTEVAVPVNAPAEPSTTPTSFLLPASGEVQRPYSDTELIYFEPLSVWRCHLGIDFLPSENDAVLAVADGTVENIYEDHLYGTTVIVDHGNTLKSLYGSLSTVSVEKGAQISGGTEIGRMGETAPAEIGVHLHFSMEKNGLPIDPFGQK